MFQYQLNRGQLLQYDDMIEVKLWLIIVGHQYWLITVVGKWLLRYTCISLITQIYYIPNKQQSVLRRDSVTLHVCKAIMKESMIIWQLMTEFSRQAFFFLTRVGLFFKNIVFTACSWLFVCAVLWIYQGVASRACGQFRRNAQSVASRACGIKSSSKDVITSPNIIEP